MTRLSRNEKQDVTRRASFQYREDVKALLRRGLKPAKFAGTWAEDIVWSALRKAVGEQRADEVSTRTFKTLVEQAKREVRSDIPEDRDLVDLAVAFSDERAAKADALAKRHGVEQGRCTCGHPAGDHGWANVIRKNDRDMCSREIVDGVSCKCRSYQEAS